MLTQWLSNGRSSGASKVTVPTFDLLFLLLLLLHGKTSEALRCYVCAAQRGYVDHVTTDNFRVTIDLRTPFCQGYERMICDRDQNACMTIVTYLQDSRTYWLGKGCTTVAPAARISGCVSMASTHQEAPIFEQISRKYISSGDIVQDICLCNDDYCNSAAKASTTLLLSLLLLLIILITYSSSG